MLCPSCNKFAAQSADGDPEIDLQVDEEGMVTGTCRIVVTSECCGDELKEANFDVEIDLTEACKNHLGEGHELELSSESGSMDDRYDTHREKKLKDGTVIRKPIAPRYQTHYYGAVVEVTVRCSCDEKQADGARTPDDKRWQVDGEFKDEIAAGSMDELV